MILKPKSNLYVRPVNILPNTGVITGCVIKRLFTKRKPARITSKGGMGVSEQTNEGKFLGVRSLREIDHYNQLSTEVVENFTLRRLT